MQKDIKNLIKEYVEGLNDEFIEMKSGAYCKSNTGEIFTQSEVSKYMQVKIEKFTQEIMTEVRSESLNNNVECEQRIINTRSKNPKKNSKKKTKQSYTNGDEFNMVYRKGIEKFMSVKLDVNEKLTFYILKDLISYPTNSVVLNDSIPTIPELAPIIGLSERKVRDCLKKLESLNMIKTKPYGHRKTIYINPEYCVGGRELDIQVLEMFGLLDVDNDKLDYYLKEE